MNIIHSHSNYMNNADFSYTSTKENETDSSEEEFPVKKLPSSIEMTQCSTGSDERKTTPSQNWGRIVLPEENFAYNINRAWGVRRKGLGKDYMARMEKIIKDFDKAYAKSIRPVQLEDDSSLEMINLSFEDDRDKNERIEAMMSWNLEETKKFQTSDEGIEIPNQKSDLPVMSEKMLFEKGVEAARAKFKQFFEDFDMKTDTFKTPQKDRNVFDSPSNLGSHVKKESVQTLKGPKMSVLEIIENSRRARQKRLKLRQNSNTKKANVPIERHFDKDGSCLRVQKPERTSTLHDQKVVDPQQLRSVLKSCLRVSPRMNSATNDRIFTDMSPYVMEEHFERQYDYSKDSNIHTSSDQRASGTIAETSVITVEISNSEKTSMNSDSSNSKSISYHPQDSPREYAYKIRDRYDESIKNLQIATRSRVSSEDNLFHFSASKSTDNLRGTHHNIDTDITSFCKQISKIEVQPLEGKYDEMNPFIPVLNQSTSYKLQNITVGDLLEVDKAFDVQNLSNKKDESSFSKIVAENDQVNLAESNEQRIDDSNSVVPSSHQQPNIFSSNSQIISKSWSTIQESNLSPRSESELPLSQKKGPNFSTSQNMNESWCTTEHSKLSSKDESDLTLPKKKEPNISGSNCQDINKSRSTIEKSNLSPRSESNLPLSQNKKPNSATTHNTNESWFTIEECKLTSKEESDLHSLHKKESKISTNNCQGISKSWFTIEESNPSSKSESKLALSEKKEPNSSSSQNTNECWVTIENSKQSSKDESDLPLSQKKESNISSSNCQDINKSCCNIEHSNQSTKNGCNLPVLQKEVEEHSAGPSTRINHYSVELRPSSARQIIFYRKNSPNEHHWGEDDDTDRSQRSSRRKLEGSVQSNTFSEDLEFNLQNVYSLPVGDVELRDDRNTSESSKQVFSNLQSTCMYFQETEAVSELATVLRLKESDIGDELNKLGSYEDFVETLLFNGFLTSEPNQTF